MKIFALYSVVSAILSWLAVGMVLIVAHYIGLAATPNHRSSHSTPTPHVGGIGMVLATSVMVSWLWTTGKLSESLFLLYGLSLIMAGVGLLDDLYQLSQRLRLSVQILLIGLAVIHAFPACYDDGLVFLSTVLLIGCGVWWINLFNFMDGIDGLAASQGLFMVVAAALLLWIFGSGEPDVEGVFLLLVMLAAVLFGFLMHNWPPARIFMGDVGSTWLAFMIFTLALLAMSNGHLSLITWLVLAAVFVVDATVTLVSRMLRGEPWRTAHSTHAYQRLCRRWQGEKKAGHRMVTLLFTGINLVYIFPLACASQALPDWSVAWATLAYLPLTIAAACLGARLSEENRQAPEYIHHK